MRPLFILSFMVVLFVHDGQADVKDFLGSIERAFSVTWASIVDAIKRPVREKRVGPALKRKALRAMTTHLPYIWSSPKDSEKFLNDMSRKSASDIKVTLPLLLHPKYKAIKDWVKLGNEKVSPSAEQSSSNSTFIFPTEAVSQSDGQVDNKELLAGKHLTEDDNLVTTKMEKNEPENMKFALPPKGLTVNLMVESRNTHVPITNLTFDIYAQNKRVMLSVSQELSPTVSPKKDNRNTTYVKNCPKGYTRTGESCIKDDYKD